MKLMIRDRKAELEQVGHQDPLDLVQRSIDRMGVSDDDVLVDWIRLVHLDDEQGNPDPEIAQTARDAGINIDQVLSAEVDSDISESSHHSGGDDGGGDVGQSSHRVGDGGHTSRDSPVRQAPRFTEEEVFDHCTQDTAGQGTSGSRQRGMQHTSATSISTDNEAALSSTFESLGFNPYGQTQSPYDPYGQTESSYNPYAQPQPPFDPYGQTQITPYAVPTHYPQFILTSVEYQVPVV